MSANNHCLTQVPDASLVTHNLQPEKREWACFDLKRHHQRSKLKIKKAECQNIT